MKNYKKLGEIVKLVDERNKDEKVQTLIGVSIEKCFIKSVANTIGTDLSKYQIIRKNDFACSLMQVSRDGKIPIACLKDYDEAIMSPAYYIFRIKNTDEVLPDYLSMWFMRSEFDREAAYIAVGGVRGSMPWEDFCNMELPIPDIKEQQKIVDAYNSITKRIQIKQKINEKLMQNSIMQLEKNIGITMLLNSTKQDVNEVRKKLESNWNLVTIKDFCVDIKSGSTPSRTESSYWENGTVLWLKSGEVHNNITINCEEKITEQALEETSVKLLPKDTVLMAMYGATASEVGYLNIEATTNQAICGMICKDKRKSAYLYFALLQNQKKISSLANGGAQSNLSKEIIENFFIIVPDFALLDKLGLDKIIQTLKLNYMEIDKLQKLKQLVISRISGM
ncbi:MAG: restriction endonuclease subunit S [Spirochaetaceae bacterium]|nr:restriction endonuclease subunit S [Spirochaetaceae bacterium]